MSVNRFLWLQTEYSLIEFVKPINREIPCHQQSANRDKAKQQFVTTLVQKKNSFISIKHKIKILKQNITTKATKMITKVKFKFDQSQ